MSTTSKQAKNRAHISKKASSKKKIFSSRVCGNKVFAGCCGFKLPKISELSALKFLNNFSCKMAKALHLWRRPSTRVSSSGRSKTLMATSDTHRSKAIEDCIEFINSSSSSASASSSSLPRSISVSANPG